MQSDLQCSDVTEEVIGCAMKVHRFFGPGLPEAIYKRALLIELDKAHLNYKREVEKDIYYDEHFIGKRRLDLIMEDKTLIEPKAISEVDKSCYNQVVNYLKCSIWKPVCY